MFSFTMIYSHRKILVWGILMVVLSVPLALFWQQHRTIAKQSKRIENMENNITFSDVERDVEIANAITTTKAHERDEEIKNIIEELNYETDQTNATKYDDTLLERVFLYKN